MTNANTISIGFFEFHRQHRIVGDRYERYILYFFRQLALEKLGGWNKCQELSQQLNEFLDRMRNEGWQVKKDSDPRARATVYIFTLPPPPARPTQTRRRSPR